MKIAWNTPINRVPLKNVMLSFAQLHIMCNSIAIQFHWISISNNNERMECSISYCSTSFVMLMYPSAREFWRSLREKSHKEMTLSRKFNMWLKSWRKNQVYFRFRVWLRLFYLGKYRNFLPFCTFLNFLSFDFNLWHAW